MTTRSSLQIMVTAARLAGVPLDLIYAGMAPLEGECTLAPASTSILMNQATAARLLSIFRFKIRRIVAEGVLHPVRVWVTFAASWAKCFPIPWSEIGAPGRTRTCNLLIRSQKLYPIELPVPNTNAFG